MTSSTTLLRSCSPRVSSAQAIQPIRPQRPGAQQLSLKSSTTLLMPCNPGVNSAQASSPRSPAAQFEGPDCSTQTLNSCYAAKKLIRFMHNSAKCTSKGENGEIKNRCSLRKRLHMSWVPSPTKKKKTTTRKRRYTREIRHQMNEQRMKKGSEPQRKHPVLQNSQRRGTPLPPCR